MSLKMRVATAPSWFLARSSSVTSSFRVSSPSGPITPYWTDSCLGKRQRTVQVPSWVTERRGRRSVGEICFMVRIKSCLPMLVCMCSIPARPKGLAERSLESCRGLPKNLVVGRLSATGSRRRTGRVGLGPLAEEGIGEEPEEETAGVRCPNVSGAESGGIIWREGTAEVGVSSAVGEAGGCLADC